MPCCSQEIEITIWEPFLQRILSDTFSFVILNTLKRIISLLSNSFFLDVRMEWKDEILKSVSFTWKLLHEFNINVSTKIELFDIVCMSF